MPKMKPRKPKSSAQPKPVKFVAVQRYEVKDDEAREMFAKGEIPEPSEPYRLLLHMVGQSHDHLAEAKILLIWEQDIKPDRDGKLKLGSCQVRSDADKEASQHDVIVKLNDKAWDHFKASERLALLDHFLCEVGIVKEQDGEPRRDTRGRIVYRKRKHDVVESSDVIARHGLWIDSLKQFVSVAVRTNPGELFGGKQ